MYQVANTVMIPREEYEALRNDAERDKLEALKEAVAIAALERDAALDQLAAITLERNQALYIAAFNKKEAEKQHDLCAAALAREQQLREALELVISHGDESLRNMSAEAIKAGLTNIPVSAATAEIFQRSFIHHQHCKDLIALPQDETALRQWGAKLLREMADELGLCKLGCDEELRRKSSELEGKKCT